MILKQLLLLIIISLVCAYANGANILFMNICPSPSHHFWNRNIIHALAERGHNVTAISPDAEKSPPSGVHYMQIDGLYGDSYKSLVKSLQQDPVNPLLQLLPIFKSFEVFCKVSLESSAVNTLLNYPHNFKFDLVLYDYTNGPCLLPFLHKFGNPPLIGMSAYGNPSYTVPVAGGHQYYSYVPHNLIIADDNMPFWERVFNFAIHIEEYYLYQISMISAVDKLVQPYFGSLVPSTGELERRISVVLVNTNPVMDYSAPLPENVIPVGGLHIKDPQPLPKDIEDFMSSSTDGVVLFSLGSNFRSDFMPIEKQRMFIEAFRQLSNYHFLWKFESDIFVDPLPKNVQIRSWLPLSDALAHSNTKLIIFHGGLLTSQEALWRGVPMIIMPFAFDQHQNRIKTRRLGISEGLNYKNLSSEYIKETLVGVLTNSKYSENASRMSKKYQDQKEKPLDRAIWWIEWVLRNPNVDHLKSPVVRLGFFVGNSFDVFIFVIVVTLVLLVLFAIVFFYLIKLIISHNNLRSTSQPKSKTN